MDISAGLARKLPFKTLAYDAKDGLPIVDRLQKAEDAKPEAKPEPKLAKPEPKAAETEAKPAKAETKPDKPETAEEKPKEDKPLAKGDRVQHSDGTTGKISYLDSQLKIARITRDKGGSMSAPLSKLKAADDKADDKPVPKGHVLVASHVRKLPR